MGTRPFSDTASVSVSNPLQDGRAFVRQAQNHYFSVEPSVIHFAGCTAGATHSQTLRIRNISRRSMRVCVLPPATSFFSARMSRLGCVAPGMCEEVIVDFTPSHTSYYYDCVRIHSEGENLTVPCHGYPVAGDIRLPSHVDFGTCAINQQVRRSIEILCQAPINFEFECTEIEPHPEIYIESMAGTVHAAGGTTIELVYRPVMFRTAVMRFAFRLSQFGFDPVIVTVRGNCMPGGLTDAALRFSSSQNQTPSGDLLLLSRTRDSFGGRAEQTCNSNFFSADNGIILGYTGGGGGGRQDLVSSHLASRQRSERSERLNLGGGVQAGQFETRLPSFRPPTPNVTVDGICFPPNVRTHSAVAGVLTQEQGKLNIRDLRKSIEESKGKTQTKGGQEVDEGQDNMSHSGKSRQLLETIFERKFHDIDVFERSKEIKWFQCTGDENMSTQETQLALDQRRRYESEQLHIKEQADRRRKRTELSKSRATFPHGRVPEGLPVWVDESIEQNRMFGMERFVDAAHIVIVRGRVEKRLVQLRSVFERVGKSVAAVGSLVELWDDQEAMNVLIGRADIGVHTDDKVAVRMDVATVQRFAFPSYREKGFDDCECIETLETIPHFEELDTFQLKVTQESSLIGYRNWPVPLNQFDFPAKRVPETRTGAREEIVVRQAGQLPCSLDESVASASAPSSLLELFFPVQPQYFAGSYAFAQYQRYQEIAAEYMLRQNLMARNKTVSATKLGLNSVAATENASRGAGPMLSANWRPSRDSVSIVTTVVGVRMAPPALLIDLGHRQDQKLAHVSDSWPDGDVAAASDEFLDETLALLRHCDDHAIAARDICARDICATTSSS